MKLAARLSALYAVLLGVTVLIVILASSIALVFELSRFSGDVMIAKHEEARILVDQYRREGMTLREAAPEIVNALSGIGLRVTVFDSKGRYLAGDKTLRPKPLDGVVAAGGMQKFIPPAPRGKPMPPDPTRLEPLSLTYVEGGYVGFGASFPLLLVSLIPYWRIVLTIALAAILLSWFVGRLFAQQSLRPIKALACGLIAGLAGAMVWALHVHSADVFRLTATSSAYAGGVGNRGDLWRAAVYFFRKHPLLGIGAGNYELELANAGVYGVRLRLRRRARQPLVGAVREERLRHAGEHQPLHAVHDQRLRTDVHLHRA